MRFQGDAVVGEAAKLRGGSCTTDQRAGHAQQATASALPVQQAVFVLASLAERDGIEPALRRIKELQLEQVPYPAEADAAGVVDHDYK